MARPKFKEIYYNVYDKDGNRLNRRYQCKKCGHKFHANFEREGRRCPVCGKGSLIRISLFCDSLHSTSRAET